MGTEARLEVVTDDAEVGEEALVRAAEDLAATERALSRFREDSDLSRLNRSGVAEPPGERLSMAIEKAIDAYEWSGGLLDPRVIDPLERFGYQGSVPLGDVGAVEPQEALVPIDVRGWIEGPGKVSLPPASVST